MEQGEEEVYDEAADGAEQGDGAEEDAGFDEDELDSALADAQGVFVLRCLFILECARARWPYFCARYKFCISSTRRVTRLYSGGGAGDESSRIRRLHSGGSQGAAGQFFRWAHTVIRCCFCRRRGGEGGWGVAV
jgi:hypothetical protein